jgi:hypothetical protein
MARATLPVRVPRLTLAVASECVREPDASERISKSSITISDLGCRLANMAKFSCDPAILDSTRSCSPLWPCSPAAAPSLKEGTRLVHFSMLARVLSFMRLACQPGIINAFRFRESRNQFCMQCFQPFVLFSHSNTFLGEAGALGEEIEDKTSVWPRVIFGALCTCMLLRRSSTSLLLINLPDDHVPGNVCVVRERI